MPITTILAAIAATLAALSAVVALAVWLRLHARVTALERAEAARALREDVEAEARRPHLLH